MDNKPLAPCIQSSPKPKDETDAAMIPEVVPVYERLRAGALAFMQANPHSKQTWACDYASENGKKLTVVVYLTRWTGDPDKIDEQVEYYQYRYFHLKPVVS